MLIVHPSQMITLLSIVSNNLSRRCRHIQLGFQRTDHPSHVSGKVGKQVKFQLRLDILNRGSIVLISDATLPLSDS